MRPSFTLSGLRIGIRVDSQARLEAPGQSRHRPAALARDVAPCGPMGSCEECRREPEPLSAVRAEDLSGRWANGTPRLLIYCMKSYIVGCSPCRPGTDHTAGSPRPSDAKTQIPPGATSMRKRQPWNASSTTQRFPAYARAG